MNLPFLFLIASKWHAKKIINFLFGLGINAMLFIPQVIKLIQTKDSKGLSLLMFGGFSLLQIISVLHGLVVSDHILCYWFFVKPFNLWYCFFTGCLLPLESLKIKANNTL